MPRIDPVLCELGKLFLFFFILWLVGKIHDHVVGKKK